MEGTIDPSARVLMAKGLAWIPELQGLPSDQALEIVKDAEQLAADEQDVSFYEKVTSPRYVLQFAALLLAATIGAFALWWGTFAYFAYTFDLGRGGGRLLFWAELFVVLGVFHLGMRVYRRQTPQRMRRYIVNALKRRARASSAR